MLRENGVMEVSCLGDCMIFSYFCDPIPVLLRWLAEMETGRTNRRSGLCDGILPLQGELEGVFGNGYLNL
jgi:hypothetical protein